MSEKSQLSSLPDPYNLNTNYMRIIISLHCTHITKNKRHIHNNSIIMNASHDFCNMCPIQEKALRFLNITEITTDHGSF